MNTEKKSDNTNTQSNPNTWRKPWLKHVALIVFLLCLGFGVVAGILLCYGDQAENTRIGTAKLAFMPTYNRNGSWFHGVLRLGYQRFLLSAEHVLTLLILIFLMRYLGFMNYIFKMRQGWLFGIDFGIATTIARALTILAGRYTLDYLYIAGFTYPGGSFGGVYDLFDFYLGIMILTILIWLLFAYPRYNALKKRMTKGFGFWRRQKWELILTADTIRAAIQPQNTWQAIAVKYQSSELTGENSS